MNPYLMVTHTRLPAIISKILIHSVLQIHRFCNYYIIQVTCWHRNIKHQIILLLAYHHIALAVVTSSYFGIILTVYFSFELSQTWFVKSSFLVARINET